MLELSTWGKSGEFNGTSTPEKVLAIAQTAGQASWVEEGAAFIDLPGSGYQPGPSSCQKDFRGLNCLSLNEPRALEFAYPTLCGDSQCVKPILDWEEAENSAIIP